MKVLVGAFNQKKALEEAFSVIVKLQTSRRFVSSSTVYCMYIMADNPQPYTNKYYHNSAKQESLLPTEWLSNDIFGAHHTLSPPSTASLQRMAPTLKTTHINTQE